MEGEARNRCLEYLVNKLNSRISFSHTILLTKKTIILRTLEDALSEAFIPESTLQILEVLEKLLLCSDSSDSNSISASMKEAYCSIAVECTLKYLETGTSNPNYGKAVERIWKGRVHDMQIEGSSFLLSDELKQWKCEIENSLLDEKVMEKLASMQNTRRNAIQKVGAFLGEAWENLGSSFLESAAKNPLEGNVGVLHMNKQQEKAIQKENEKVDGKFTATVGVEEVALSTSCSKGESVPISESVELQTLAKDPGLIIEDTNQEPQMENRSMDANEANLNETASVHQSDAHETASVRQSDAHRPSLMEPNTTARTHKLRNHVHETKTHPLL